MRGGGGGVFSPSRNVSSIRVFINHTEAFRAAGTRVSHGEISLEFHLADALSDLGELAWIIFLGDDGRETVLRRRGRKKTTPKTQTCDCGDWTDSRWVLDFACLFIQIHLPKIWELWLLIHYVWGQVMLCLDWFIVTNNIWSPCHLEPADVSI